MHPLAGIVQVVEGEGKRYLICDFRYFFNHDKAGHVVEAKLPHIKAIKYISDLSPNKKLIAYFSAEPLYKESPIEQTFKKKKDEKGKGDKDAAKEPVREPYGYAYRLIVAPSINSDSIESNKFKSIDLPFVRDGVHLNTKDKLQKL